MSFDDTLQRDRNEAHLGRNIQRIREMLGMKQLTLADACTMSQQNISKIEGMPVIPEETLEKLAKGLGVSTEFIKSFNEEKAIYNIQSNITVSENSTNNNQLYYPTINNSSEIEKVIELFDKLLQSEKEKVELLTKANEALQALLKESKK